MLLNALLIALREIRRNVVRSILTVLGIVIGVASVITMVTLGRGATEVVKSNISKLGNNLLVLRAGESWWSGNAPLFSMNDIRAVADQVPGVAAVAPMVTENMRLGYMENSYRAEARGTTPEYFGFGNWELADGRFFTDEEVADGAMVVVIGETIRREVLGEGVNPIGARIRMKSTSLTVIGVLASKGMGGFGDDLDATAFLPYTTHLQRFSGRRSSGSITQIMIAGADGYPSANIMADVSLLMRERRDLTSNQENNFNIFDSQQLTEVISASTKVLTALLGAVAGVSLLVGGIGIMNIMLVSVTERTREIGIRMAIGARAREVLWQFLVEAVTLSCVGGITGIGLAYGLCYFLKDVVGAPFIFDPWINLEAFVFSAAMGCIFGFMPALRAARLDPIDALRHE